MSLFDKCLSVGIPIFFVCGSMCVALFQNLYYYNSYEQTKWVVNIIQTNKRKMTVAVDFMAVNRNQMNLLNKIKKKLPFFFSLYLNKYLFSEKFMKSVISGKQ